MVHTFGNVLFPWDIPWNLLAPLKLCAWKLSTCKCSRAWRRQDAADRSDRLLDQV